MVFSLISHAQNPLENDLSQVYGLGTLADISYSRDFSAIATVGSRGLVLWEHQTIPEIVVREQLSKLSLSPQGNYAALYRLGELRLPFLEYGPSQLELLNLATPNTPTLGTWENVSLACFSADERYLSFSTGRELQILSLPDLRVVQRHSESDEIVKVLWADKLPLLLSANKREVTLRDIHTQTQLSRWRYSKPLQSMRFSADASYIITIYGDESSEVSFYNWEQGLRPALELEGLIGESYALSSDNRYFAVRVGRGLQLWGLEPNQLTPLTLPNLATYLKTAEVLESLTFKPDSSQLAFGVKLASSQQVELLLWDVATDAKLNSSEITTDHLAKLSFSDSGEQLLGYAYNEIPNVGRYDQGLYLWEVDALPKAQNLMVGYLGSDITTMLSPQGHYLAAAEIWGGPIYLWSIHETSIPHRLGNGPYRWLQFSPDGLRLLAGSSRHIDVWDIASETPKHLSSLETGTSLHQLPEGLGAFKASYSPQGSQVLLYFSYPTHTLLPAEARAEAYRLELRDGQTFELIRSLQLDELLTTEGTITEVAFGKDEQTFAVLVDAPYWDVQLGSIANKLIYVFNSAGESLLSFSGLQTLSLSPTPSQRQACPTLIQNYGIIRLENDCSSPQ